MRARAAQLATLELGPHSDIDIRRDLDAQVEADRLTRLDHMPAREAAQRDGTLARIYGYGDTWGALKVVRRCVESPPRERDDLSPHGEAAAYGVLIPIADQSDLTI
jgi:type IV secretory pathway VirD2 relaxase